MANQENNIDQDPAIDPVEAFLTLLSGSGVAMAEIGRTIGQGMQQVIDGWTDFAKEVGKLLGTTYDTRFNFLSDEEIKKLRREKRRARYHRIMTGKHKQRARSSRG